MIGYRLKKLYFKNFKLFDGEGFTVNFDVNDLVVFDGPNGYGKTTVFDAVELALTGDIRRLLPVENKQIPVDVVVAYNQATDCQVHLTISNTNDDSVATIIRKLKVPLPPQSTKIGNFEALWELSKKTNGNQIKITQKELDDFVGTVNLKRDFTLFHYVEQEDTAHFLRLNSEVKRAEALSKLFGNTTEMQLRHKKLEDVDKYLRTQISKYKQEKIKLQSHYGFSEEQTEVSSAGITEYKVLLNWRTPHFEWDFSDIKEFTVERKNEFVNVLEGIKSLIKHRDEFLSLRVFRQASSQVEVLKCFLKYRNYISDLDSLLKKQSQIKELDNLFNQLESKDFEAVLNNVEIQNIFNLTNYPNGELFLKTLEELVRTKNRNSSGNELYGDLIKYRNELHDKFHDVSNDKNCPFCGSDFESRELLVESINERGKYFESMLSEDGKKLIQTQEKFVKDFFLPLASIVREFIKISKPPSDELIRDMRIAHKLEVRFDDLTKWLESESIIYEDILFSYSGILTSDHEVTRVLDTLLQRIEDKSPVLSKEFISDNSIADFEIVYSLYFNKKHEYLKQIESQNVDEKITYILEQYSNSVSIVFSDYLKIKNKITNFEAKRTVLEPLKKKLKTIISTYQKKLIRDVEIPFYIYSGKILQTHQSGIGNGIFIKDKTGKDELKNVRFVANWDSDHDILNTMSSGQIAAVVISLYLSLNKVYVQGLQTILIDDPVQSMDEINMISLVEILRNEFSDKQIILSTHEDNVSKYFVYKFLKYGLSTKLINLMDREEYQFSNTEKQLS